MLLRLLTIVVLLIIVYDDLRYRSVRLFLFPALALLLAYGKIMSSLLSQVALYAVVNMFYVSMTLAVCYVYLIVRRKGSLFAWIGMGDVLLLICLSMWFDPIQFIFFNTISITAALLIHLVLINYFKSLKIDHTIPLAGYQSLFFVFVLIGVMV
jgi:hypothetical protein